MDGPREDYQEEFMRDKKPREFRLEVDACFTHAFSWDPENMNHIETGETIHVREILEGEPDWRGLCEMMAGELEYQKRAWQWFKTGCSKQLSSYQVKEFLIDEEAKQMAARNQEKADKALEKYNQAKGNPS